MSKHPLTIVYRPLVPAVTIKPSNDEEPPAKKPFIQQNEHEIKPDEASSSKIETLIDQQKITVDEDELIDMEEVEEHKPPLPVAMAPVEDVEKLSKVESPNPKIEPIEEIIQSTSVEPIQQIAQPITPAKAEPTATDVVHEPIVLGSAPVAPVAEHDVSADSASRSPEPPKPIASSSADVKPPLSNAEIRSQLSSRIQENLLEDCLNERSRLHGYGLSLKNALKNTVQSLSSSRKFITNDLRKLHEDQDALCVEFEFQCREMQTAAKNHEASLAKERVRMSKMHDRDERRIFDAKAHATCCKDATREMKCEVQVEVLKVSTLERDLAACQQKLHDKIYVATNASCSKCKSSEKVRNMLESKVVDLTRDRDKTAAKLDTARTELDKKERIVRILTKSTERAQFEAKSAKEHLQSEIALAVKRREEELAAAAPITNPSRTPGSAPNPSPPVSDASPCSTPRDTAGTSSDTRRSSAKKSRPTTTTADGGDAVGEGGDDDEVDPNDPEWLTSQLDGYKNICEWYRKEVKTLTDESNFYAAESETSLLRVDALTEERKETSKLSTALAASQAECEDLRRHLATLTESVKAYIGVNGDND